ncbi:MAG: glucose 1-dehydrogenase [Candidatus Krumholzibacteriia bacterium]
MSNVAHHRSAPDPGSPADAPPVALVTGGSQGIGKAVTLAFHARGHAVVVADLDGQAGTELAAELATDRLLFVAADVGREPDVRELVAAALARFGRLDVLVNNAGIMIRKSPEDLLLEEWRRVLDTNLTGAFLCTRHALPHLRRSRGAVVNVASTRALMSEPDTEAYAASKGGLLALTHALALSCGPEVRVNAVSPGWIEVSAWQKRSRRQEPALRPEDHAQHPAGRVGTPDDVARAVLYLCAPENGFLTGANLVLDGGMTRKMIYAE